MEHILLLFLLNTIARFTWLVDHSLSVLQVGTQANVESLLC